MERINTRMELVYFISEVEKALSDINIPKGFSLKIEIPYALAESMTNEFNNATKINPPIELITKMDMGNYTVEFCFRKDD
jgi:hypothetical protein